MLDHELLGVCHLYNTYSEKICDIQMRRLAHEKLLGQRMDVKWVNMLQKKT